MPENTALSLFGALIREYREKADWSLSELACRLEKIGYTIHITTINKYELGHRRPRGDFIAYLQKCFNWSGEEVDVALGALIDDYMEELREQYLGALCHLIGTETEDLPVTK